MKKKFAIYFVVVLILALISFSIMIRSQLPLTSPSPDLIIGLEAFFILTLLVAIFSIQLISSQSTVSVAPPVIWSMIVILIFNSLFLFLCGRLTQSGERSLRMDITSLMPRALILPAIFRASLLRNYLASYSTRAFTERTERICFILLSVFLMLIFLSKSTKASCLLLADLSPK